MHGTDHSDGLREPLLELLIENRRRVAPATAVSYILTTTQPERWPRG
jgi:hypothetical protein